MSTYTPKEARQILNIPASTLRRYVLKFPEYLSPETKKKRNRRYTENDLNIIATIRQLSDQGARLKDIPEQLEGMEFPDKTSPAVEELALATVSNKVDDIYTIMNNLLDRIDKLEEWQRTPWYKRIGKNPPK